MAKKFIKTIYVEIKRYSASNPTEIRKVDLYETDCYVIYKTTTIENEVYERKDKKGTSWFEYSTAKEYLKIEFNQKLCDEFERQWKEYRKKVTHDAEQSVAKRNTESIMSLFTGALHTEYKKFKGDWVEFAKKIDIKTNEMYQDFLKFMKENN